MNNFEKQIREQMKIHQIQLQDKIKRLGSLMKRSSIDNKSKLDAVDDREILRETIELLEDFENHQW